MRKLSLRILELICEGLGLEHGYFGEDLTGAQLLSINHYPKCPDPSFTLGLQKHADPSLITVLSQGSVNGLQVFKDGQWLGVEPVPHAFVVNIGHQLKVAISITFYSCILLVYQTKNVNNNQWNCFQIISNGKLRSAEHRAVTNSREARTSIVTFINPCQDTIVEPAKSMVGTDVPLFRPIKYKDFFKLFEEKKGDTKATTEVYKIKP